MDFPNWKSFTPSFASEELTRLIGESEDKVAALERSNAADFETLVYALNDATRELWRIWGMVSHLLGVANSKEWREVEEKFQPQMVAFSLRVGQSRPLYEAAKQVLSRESDPVRRRILSKMVEAADHAGVGLEGEKRERFNAIQSELAKLAADFHNAVIDATTPDIADAVYVEAMKHEMDSKKREELYRKRSTRAPENAPRIDRILELRRELAALLGYGDYAALSLSSKCAPDAKAVMKLIDRLDEATREPAAKEKAELGEALKPWDVAYAAERLRERKFSYSEDEVKRCFKFPAVLSGLFKMVRFLFEVDVEEIAADEKPSVWHPDVRFFAVKENGRTIARFYLDAYARPGEKSGGAWMNEFANLSSRLGEQPLAVVVLNLKDDAMPMREVETLYHEFGHALQCMLTRVGEEDAAGINLVEWDAVEVASQFMENWCLDDRTGVEVPSDLKAKLKSSKTFRAASACRRQLAFAKTDMELHGSDAVDADAVKRRNFEHFDLPSIEGDLFLCAFTHIFAGGYAAGYYGYKWAEVMSDDCYGAFTEAGLVHDAALKETGRRYRDTVLALGGSMSALDVFRRFRGRDPDIAAHLANLGLTPEVGCADK